MVAITLAVVFIFSFGSLTQGSFPPFENPFQLRYHPRVFVKFITEITTEDNEKYNFYPITSGSVQFQVKAAHDAHVALTPEPIEKGFIVEVYFGGWKNKRSVIRRDRDKQNKAEVQTPDIVSADEFRGFWIRWGKGIIRAGLEGETIALLTWEDPKPFPIAYVGVSTGWGSSGIWKVEGMPELHTPDELSYKFQPVLAGSLEFEFRGPHDCHVALTPGPAEMAVMYEVILGGWKNTRSAIKYSKEKPNKVEVETPGLFNPKRFKKFVIEWRRGLVKVRDENDTVIMEWQDFTSFGITHFGVRTVRGATGEWRISTIPMPSSSE